MRKRPWISGLLVASVLLALGQACSGGFRSLSLSENFDLGSGLAPSARSYGASQQIEPPAKSMNSTIYAQDPVDDSLFFTRRLSDDNLRWELWTVRWDGQLKFSWLKRITPLVTSDKPFGIGDGRVVTTAYDPSVASYHGERLIAFECSSDPKFNSFNGTVAACVGALNEDDTINASSTAVTVDGLSGRSEANYFPSASVPKLMVDGDDLYLFWSQVLVGKTGKAPDNFLGVTTWGAKLQKDGHGHYWIKGAASAQPADTALATQVWGGKNPVVADAADIMAVGSRWLVAGQIGDRNGCAAVTDLVTHDPLAGCYTLKLGWVNKGLGDDQFGKMESIIMGFETQTVQYPRVVRDTKSASRLSLLFNVVGSPFMTLLPIPIAAEQKPAPTPGSTAASTDQSTSTSTETTQVNSPALSAQGKFMRALFLAILSREPDPSTIAAAERMTCVAMGTMVALSSEAISNHYNSMDHSAFVSYLYGGVLGRSADPAGLNAWTAELTSSRMTRNDVIAGILGSDEYAARCVSNGVR